MTEATPERRNLNAAIERYDAWEAPWKFHQTVRADPSIDNRDRADFDSAWAAANESRHWMSGSLSEAADRAGAALAERFPWLSRRAIAQISNGAAYQWK